MIYRIAVLLAIICPAVAVAEANFNCYYYLHDELLIYDVQSMRNYP